MAGPWEKYGGTESPAGPVYGPPPKAPAPPTALQLRDQQLQEEAAARAAEAHAVAMEKARQPEGGKGADAKTQAKLANLEALTGQINRVQYLYNSNLRDEAIPLLSSLWEYLPTPANRQFDSAAAGMAEQGLAAFRVPGVGAQSDTELKQFVDANKPSASDADLSIEEKLRQLRARVQATREQMGLPPAQWEGIGETDDPEPVAAATPPADPGMVNPVPGETGPGLVPATGGQRLVADPETQARVDAMLRAGAPYSEINRYAVSRGNAPVNPRQYAEVRAFLRKNPNYQGSLVNALKAEEMDGYDQFITGVVGSDPTGLAGYAMGAGQFLSGNTLDNLAADPERARQSMDVIRQESPTATTLGELSGGTLAALTGEAGLARLGMASGIGRAALADVSMGAANGAGMADAGNRGMGAVQGGISAGAGSLAGAGAMNLAGRAMSPSGGSLADLYQSGVRPTIGQRVANANDGRGLTGMVGKAVNATEEALQSVPVVGSAIRGARQDARDQFQIGAFNQALAEIGEELPRGMKPGTDPNKFAQEAFNRVYEKARSGMTMVADEELSNDLGNLAPDIATLGPAAQNKLKAIMSNSVNNRLVNGAMNGEGYKKATSMLGKHIARLSKSTSAEEQQLADVLTGVQGALDSAARRHSNPDAVALLDAADAGYSKLVRIEEAASRRGGDAGTFSPAGFDSSVQKTSGGVRSKAYLRGDAQMQDYAMQGRTLEDRLPNSGTFDRAALGTVAAGGAAYLEPTTLTALGAIAGAYAPGVRRAVAGAMSPGGPTRKAISQQLKRRARLAGKVGAASAVAALPGTTPGQ